MTRKTNPIGVFDSGIGGLTVVNEIQRLLPSEDIVYFGDTARVPYGNKSKKTVTRFSVENVQFLMRYKVKMVVVACNTSSSLSLDFLKRCFKMNIIGVITPGAIRAASVTENRKVGIIGTKATIESGAYTREIKKMDPKISCYARACPLFVPLVEEGWPDERITHEVAKRYLADLKSKAIDVMILGCTHYPILKPVIRDVIGHRVTLIDSAEEVALAVRTVLEKRGLLRTSNHKPSYRFFVSDDPKAFVKVGQRFLKMKLRCAMRSWRYGYV